MLQCLGKWRSCGRFLTFLRGSISNLLSCHSPPHPGLLSASRSRHRERSSLPSLRHVFPLPLLCSFVCFLQMLINKSPSPGALSQPSYPKLQLCPLLPSMPTWLPSNKSHVLVMVCGGHLSPERGRPEGGPFSVSCSYSILSSGWAPTQSGPPVGAHRLNEFPASLQKYFFKSLGSPFWRAWQLSLEGITALIKQYWHQMRLLKLGEARYSQAIISFHIGLASKSTKQEGTIAVLFPGILPKAERVKNSELQIQMPDSLSIFSAGRLV